MSNLGTNYHKQVEENLNASQRLWLFYNYRKLAAEDLEEAKRYAELQKHLQRPDGV